MRRFAPFVGLVLTVAGACGGPQGVGGAGSECFRDDECAFGMVCAVPAGEDARVCTSDVSGLISELPPGASEGGRTPMGGGAAIAGRTNGASGGANGNTGGTTAGTGAGAPSSGGAMNSGGGPLGGTAGAPPGGNEPQAGAAGSAS
ncbi:MAG TPA: hypothetical protein VIM73_07025 [Polyangiaceae bacterium]